MSGVVFLPRVARKKSKSGIYHVIIRGINRQILFEEREDYKRFIKVLQKYKATCKYRLFAYCLMSNHVHLLLMVGEEPLGTVMRKICSSYALWYNKKYDRVGYLFQDRFKSEPIEDEVYFLTVLKYVFRNPVKAGIVAKVEDYIWTNYIDYIDERKNKTGINNTDLSFVLNIFNTSRKEAISSFIEYVNDSNNDQCNDQCLDIWAKRQLSDEEAKKIIQDHCNLDYAQDLQKLDKDIRDLHLKKLKENYGLSIRQIERLTGIGRGIVQRA
jgi:putative transposase